MACSALQCQTAVLAGSFRPVVEVQNSKCRTRKPDLRGGLNGGANLWILGIAFETVHAIIHFESFPESNPEI